MRKWRKESLGHSSVAVTENDIREDENRGTIDYGDSIPDRKPKRTNLMY